MTGKDAGNDKKARLAEALRANLRRRREQIKRRAVSDAGMIGAEMIDVGAPEIDSAPIPAVNPPQSPPKRRE